jgi:hypothetical protein
MTNDIYQTPPTRDKWTFRKLNEKIKYQHKVFGKQCSMLQIINSNNESLSDSGSWKFQTNFK